ncbi:MAG: DUF6340 family protein [Bacteroidales bacterium]|nr:DUF6340 family protein [Bacteroidales bacterium]
MNRHLLIILSAASILLSGCGASRISFDVLAPAVQYIPPEINTVTLVNRSFPANREANMLEGLLTGEGLKQDTMSSDFVLRGLSESMNGSGRFNVKKAKETMPGSGIGNLLPEALDWETVESICHKYSTDALLALEAYDSDFIITGAAAGRKLIDMQAQGIVTVNCGLRMYHPSSRSIIDEFMYKHEMEWGTGGFSIVAAANAIINKKRAVESASLEAGNLYGRRLIPEWMYVSREYFRKGKGNPYLEEGARMMEVNDWDKAIAALEKAMESNKRKVRGRAAHNLAVIYEILGDLYKAKEWATIAWGRYKEKESREYGYILTRRIQEAENINYRMNR